MRSKSWPRWARRLVSLALAFHIASTLIGAVAAPPSSRLAMGVAPWFKAYWDFTNQGHAYRYYARLRSTTAAGEPRPWGTPIVVAVMEFPDEAGQATERTVRLPGLDRPWPRLRHQRQIDLAYHLASDPRWAASYARHLAKTYHCRRATLYSQMHYIPDPDVVRRAAGASPPAPVDFEADDTYGPRVLLGAFECDGF